MLPFFDFLKPVILKWSITVTESNSCLHMLLQNHCLLKKLYERATAKRTEETKLGRL